MSVGRSVGQSVGRVTHLFEDPTSHLIGLLGLVPESAYSRNLNLMTLFHHYLAIPHTTWEEVFLALMRLVCLSFRIIDFH